MTKREQRERIRRLAKVLCMTPTKDGPELERWNGRWWLTKCVEGDQPLPMSGHSHTINDCLDVVEAWLAPAIDKLTKQDLSSWPNKPKKRKS